VSTTSGPLPTPTDTSAQAEDSGSPPAHAQTGATAFQAARAAARRHTTAALAIVIGALALWAICGVGFVNYDTLYALVWGAQLTRGQTPEYGLPIAPTPHPLVELLGVPLAPLPAGVESALVVALAFVALSASGWVIYRLGSEWFGRAAGALAALVWLTRVPVLSYGVRAYVDVPYTLLVLCALLVETRSRRAGGRAAVTVLALLALAGLLRPEAWVFSGLYWLYLAWSSRRSYPARSRRELAWLALLAAAAPLVWVASDLLVSGNPLWSLQNTKHTATTLGRPKGIADVPQYVPRRIGEVLQAVALAAAAIGAALSLWWLRRRALPGAIAGVAAIGAFALLSSAGLPIDTRYAFLTAAILCLFCGAAAFGWSALPAGDRRRAAWMGVGAVVLVALVASTPAQLRSAHRELAKLSRQQSIQSDLLELVKSGAISLRCGPVGVPNHAPIPLLALYLGARPGLIVSAEASPIARGVYVDPASREVETEYVLDAKDPHAQVSIPPGFGETATNRSWLIFKRCQEQLSK
jgi:hypothetical protein